MDFAQRSEYEMATTMMVAIRCHDTRVDDCSLRADWVWQFWQRDWVFRQESEVWGESLSRLVCPATDLFIQNALSLPCLSFCRAQEYKRPIPLLYASKFIHPLDRIYLSNLPLLMCHEIFSMASRSLWIIPVSGCQIPKPDTHACLDTGDVRFVCLEKLNPEIHSNVPQQSPKLEAGLHHRPPSSSSSHSTFSSATTARKRIIYAHSDILTRRSEYFATMLSSAFAEGAEPSSGERRVYTVVVEEADFETMYWLLKFCYTNWLLFREQDDPRAAVEGVGAGWSARWLASRNGEWDWKTLLGSVDETLMDARSATSGESHGTTMPDVNRSTSRTSEAFRQSAMTTVVNTTTSGTAVVKVSPSSSSSAHQRNRRPMPGASTLPVPVGGTSSPSRPKPESSGLSPSRYAGAASSKHFPISPRTPRSQQSSLMSTLDPHPHPAPQPPPASALSMYQVAHRYTMPGLADLALEHMMATMTPQSSFALLLATATWDELHILVQVSNEVAIKRDYILKYAGLRH